MIQPEIIENNEPFVTGITDVPIGKDGFRLLTGRFAVGRFKPTLFPELGIDLPWNLAFAAHRRQGEYLAGRIMARRLLQDIGASAHHVGYGSNRLPLWPSDTRGSISHARSFVASLGGCTNDHHVGVDVEAMLTLQSLPAVRRAALTEHDHQVLSGEVSIRDATTIFSAKETLYKTLYPRVQQRFGFDAADIVDPPAGDHVVLRLTRDLAQGLNQGDCFRVEVIDAPDHVLTWLILPDQKSTAG